MNKNKKDQVCWKSQREEEEERGEEGGGAGEGRNRIHSFLVKSFLLRKHQLGDKLMEFKREAVFVFPLSRSIFHLTLQTNTGSGSPLLIICYQYSIIPRKIDKDRELKMMLS